MLVATEAELVRWVRETKAQIRRGLGLPPTWDDLMCWDCPEMQVEWDERGEPVRVWWLVDGDEDVR